MARNAQYASFFSYNIQRPYPLRWFTPVAIVGGIIFTVLISFANFVASGYELTTVYASDPSTVGQDLWFKSWPSWLRKNIDATCEPANLPVNSQFFTNQTALSYTLTSIVITEGGTSSTSSSLPYLNNVLEHCEIFNITMDFDCSHYQNPTQIASTMCGIDVRAYSGCTIDGPNGATTFNFSSEFNPFQSHFSPGSSNFIGTNITSRASLWWAQQLLTTYWFDTDIVVYENLIDLNSNSYNRDKGIVSGAANFYRNQRQQDVEKLDFFDLWFDFTAWYTITFMRGRNFVQAFIEEPDVAGTDGPPIWSQADKLAKSMYSAVLTDLGQASIPLSSNIVADGGALQAFSERFPSLHYGAHIVGTPFLNAVVPNGTYDDLRSKLGSGPLQITPSVISTKYLCSVPRMKSAGNIFISILLADLVLLNAVWVLYRLLVERFFVRGPTANYCEGCLNATHEPVPLREISWSRPSPIPKPFVREFDIRSLPTGYEPVQLRRTDSSDSLVGRTGYLRI